MVHQEKEDKFFFCLKKKVNLKEMVVTWIQIYFFKVDLGSAQT